MPPFSAPQSPTSQSPGPVDPPASAERQIHTYHCLCSTLLLATPYLVSSLPKRAPPAKDRAWILPLPTSRNQGGGNRAGEDQDNEDGSGPDAVDSKNQDIDESVPGITSRKNQRIATGIPPSSQKDVYLPSLLLPALRPARKITVLQREDGWERRRVWHCGRCGVGVGYEVESEMKEGMRVMFLLEGGLLRTEEMLDEKAGRNQAMQEG